MLEKISDGKLYSIEVKGKIRIRPDYYDKYLPMELTATPAKILHFLIKHSDTLLPLESLIQMVWGDKKPNTLKTVSLLGVYMVAVRSFLEDCQLDVEIFKIRDYIYFRTVPTNTLLH